MSIRSLTTITGMISLIVLALSHQTAKAQEASNEVETDGEVVLEMEPVVVTATRSPVSAFEYPGMVSVVGRDHAGMRQASTPDDILKLIPNVEFYGGPRRTGESPSIRGFSGADVIVLFDDARQNFGSTHDGRFFIDPSLLRRVEVLRGSSSSLYGSGGLGGVLAFRTVGAADFLDHGKNYGITFSAGNQAVNDELAGTTTFYGRTGEGVDFVGSLTKKGSGAIALGNGTEVENTSDDILSSLGKIGVSFGRYHRLEGTFIGFNNTAEEPDNGQVVATSTAAGLVEKAIRSNTFRVAYGYRNPGNNLLDLDLVAYRTDLRADELRLDDLGRGPKGELLTRDVRTIGARLENRSRLGADRDATATFTYGGEYYRDDQDGSQGGQERDGVPDGESRFLGTFLQAELALRKPLGVIPGQVNLLTGIRYDDFELSSELGEANAAQEFSTRTGLSYFPRNWMMTFASWGQAFRAPTLNEIYLTGVHFAIPLGRGAQVVNRFVTNPDLKPQKTETFEYGGGFRFDNVTGSRDRLWIKASRFHVSGADFIATSVIQSQAFGACFGPPHTQPPVCSIPGAFDGTTESSNVASASLDGTEVEAMYQSGVFRLGVGYSIVNGTDDESGEPLGSLVLTPHQFTIDGALSLSGLDSVIGLRMLAAGRFDKVTDPQDELDSYTVPDVYFIWRPSRGPLMGLRLDLGIDNVTDKAYARVNPAAFEPGRNFRASVSYSFSM